MRRTDRAEPRPHEPFRADRILEAMSDGFVALDRDWFYTYVNAEAARLFGRRPDELVGRHIWTEFPEGVGQPFHARYEEAMTSRRPVFFEDYYAPWDRWFENRVYPSDGGLLIFFHEITARKRLEALLAGQRQILEMIARGTPLSVTLAALITLVESQAPGLLGSVLLLDETGTHVRHGAAPRLPPSFSHAFDGQPIGPRAGSCGTAAYLGRAVFVDDIATDPLWDAYREVALAHEFRACWSTPIVDTGNRVVGTFAFYFREPPPPHDVHRELIDLATQTASVAIGRHWRDHAVRSSEERLRLAVDAAHVGTFDWDMVGNRIAWSPWHAEFWGFAPGEFDGTYEAFASRVHGDDLPGIAAEVARCSAARAPFEREFRVVWPDGTEHWIQGRGEFAFDEAGQPVRMVGAVIDVTERRRIEREVRRQAALLDQAYDAVFVYPPDGATVFWNKGAERLYGIAASEAMGVLPSTLLRSIFPSGLHETMEILARAGHWEGEVEQGTAAGRRIQVECRMTLVRQGAEVLVLEANRDITAHKEGERALQASREQLRQLAASLLSAREEERARLSREIHDELGQMLTGLKMDASWLGRHVPARADTLQARIAQMTDLVDNAIRAVRRVATDLRPGVLDDLGLAAALEWQAREFTSRSTIDCTLLVDIDERRLTPQATISLFRIFQESLTNVARHAQASRVTASLGLRDGAFVLEVSDDGRGIAERDVASPRSIGLAGMRERAEIAGGRFSIRGGPNGTTVVVSVPASPADGRA